MTELSYDHAMEVTEESGFLYVRVLSDYLGMDTDEDSDLFMRSRNVYEDGFGIVHILFPHGCLRHIQ